MSQTSEQGLSCHRPPSSPLRSPPTPPEDVVPELDGVEGIGGSWDAAGAVSDGAGRDAADVEDGEEELDPVVGAAGVAEDPAGGSFRLDIPGIIASPWLNIVSRAAGEGPPSGPLVRALVISGISPSKGSKNPDDGLPHVARVESSLADRPVEWLAAIRRQMPASWSRRSPATSAA